MALCFESGHPEREREREREREEPGVGVGGGGVQKLNRTYRWLELRFL